MASEWVRKYNKYGRKMTDKQCVLCQKYDSIFAFDQYGWRPRYTVCHGCMHQAVLEACKPNYPVPATMENVDAFWRQYWRTSNMGEYREQYETNTMPRAKYY